MTDQLLFSFTKPISAREVHHLLQQTSWAAERTLEDVSFILGTTRVCLGVWQEERLVGFGRALTDDRYRALVDDIVLDGSLRGQGVGGRIMQTLMERLSHVEEVMLGCSKELVPFYERYGFVRSDSANFMQRRLRKI